MFRLKQAEEAGRRTDALRFCDEMGRFSARYGGGDDALRGQQVALQARREAAAERRGSLETGWPVGREHGGGKGEGEEGGSGVVGPPAGSCYLKAS